MGPNIDSTSGLMAGVRFVPSPNHDERPDGADAQAIVVHSISLPPGEYGGEGIVELFTNRLDPGAHPLYPRIAELKVSAHFLVRRDGSLIQFVPVHRRAWHAGQSWCEGRRRVNDFSIGIELEGTDHDPFEGTQYASLASLTRALMRRFPGVTRERIYGHSDIAPGRKTDPGPQFDWHRYLDLLA
jgi:N-acetyl-anhydromuramoyl-L-alanine amidase